MIRAILLGLLLALSLNARAATVTGTFALNFAVVGDANPYSDANLTPLTPQTTRIASGVLRSVDAFTNSRHILASSAWTMGSTLRTKAEISNTGGGIDGVVLGAMDASGNGYLLIIGSNGIGYYRFDAFVQFFDTGWFETVAISNGDTIELGYVKGTGAITVYRNGAEITAMATTDATYGANALAPFWGVMPGDTGNGGIISIAADGVTAAGGGGGLVVNPISGRGGAAAQPVISN